MTTTLAFDTATSFGAVCALDGRVASRARAGDVLEAVDELLDDPSSIALIVVGRGPGSFTSIRIGLAVARTLSLALGVPVTGASTLDAYAGADALPVIDARRGEVFTTGPTVARPDDLRVDGKTLVGDGAVRYRDVFERNGALVPPDDDPRHRPDPARLADHATPDIGPLYVRDPDAKPSR